jgi:fluoroacetyl-CoA thioesterase
MKSSLQPGISLVRRVTVEKEKTISFMGEEGRVYGTPFLILDIEHTCRNLTSTSLIAASRPLVRRQ